jgi:cell division protein FtsW
MTVPLGKSLSRLPVAITPVGAVCLGLSLWGCLAIYSATRHLSPGASFAARQLLWVGVGTLALLVCSNLHTAFYRQRLAIFAGGTYAALWLVLIYGIRINGMRGWFAFGDVFLQPSELAKPVFVLCLAAVLERTAEHRHHWLRGYFPALAVLLLWSLPILLQPDFGAIVVYGLTFAALFWCFGGRIGHLLVSVVASLPLALWVLLRHRYVYRRLLGFLDPEAYARTAGWHVLQFRRSLASGGLLGRPLLEGRWSQAYLPLGYSDSIFASTAEAVGLLGVLPIILLIIVWIVYGYDRAQRAPDAFGSAAIAGLVTMLAAQAFIHLSVNLGLLPPTGITLPLISYGGSSLVSTLIMVGIVEGIARDASPETSPALPDCLDSAAPIDEPA